MQDDVGTAWGIGEIREERNGSQLMAARSPVGVSCAASCHMASPGSNRPIMCPSGARTAATWKQERHPLSREAPPGGYDSSCLWEERLK